MLAYADLCKVYPDLVPLPDFVAESREDIQTNLVRWADISTSFSDESSRQVLEAIVSYRLTGDSSFMKGYTVFNVEQIEDLPPHYTAKSHPRMNPDERIAHAESFFAATGADMSAQRADLDDLNLCGLRFRRRTG